MTTATADILSIAPNVTRFAVRVLGLTALTGCKHSPVLLETRWVTQVSRTTFSPLFAQQSEMIPQIFSTFLAHLRPMVRLTQVLLWFLVMILSPSYRLALSCTGSFIRRVFYRFNYSSTDNTISTAEAFVLFQTTAVTPRITIEWNDIANSGASSSAIPRTCPVKVSDVVLSYSRHRWLFGWRSASVSSESRRFRCLGAVSKYIFFHLNGFLNLFVCISRFQWIMRRYRTTESSVQKEYFV